MSRKYYYSDKTGTAGVSHDFVSTHLEKAIIRTPFSTLAKEVFNLVLTTRDRRQAFCRKFEIHLPEISWKSVTFSRSFIDHLTFQPLVVIRSYIYASQIKRMRTSLFVTLKCKIKNTCILIEKVGFGTGRHFTKLFETSHRIG